MLVILDYFLVITTSIYFITLFIFFIGLFFPNKKRQTKLYNVSVVIAARNEEKNISNILSDLINQTYPSEIFEVIVVDDHSTDRTAEIVSQIAADYSNIKIIKAQKDNTGRLVAKKNAIYQGIKNSSGEIILSTDADCRIQAGWIETMVSYFMEDVGMVVGFSQLGKKGEKRSLFEQLQAIDFLTLLSAAQGALNVHYPLASTGQNLAYRKEAFEQVGGFKEIGHRISGDDVLLLQLIYKKTNWKIRFAPSPKSFNYSLPEKTLRKFSNQRKRWASNGSYQFKLNKGFFLIVINTFLINLLLLIYLPVFLILSKNPAVALSCLFFKFLIEFLIILKGVQVYNRKDLIKYFPVWTALQIPYVVIVGLLGNIGKFVWKGREN